MLLGLSGNWTWDILFVKVFIFVVLLLKKIENSNKCLQKYYPFLNLCFFLLCFCSSDLLSVWTVISQPRLCQAWPLQENKIFVYSFGKISIQRWIFALSLGALMGNLTWHPSFQSLREYTNWDKKHIYRVRKKYNVVGAKELDFFLAGKIYFMQS